MVNDPPRLHRRSLLKGAAVGGIGMLAGCARSPLGSEGNDTDETTTTTDTTPSTDTATLTETATSTDTATTTTNECGEASATETDNECGEDTPTETATDTTDEPTTTTDEPTETATTTAEGAETVVVRFRPIDSYTGGSPYDVITVTGKRHESGPDGKPVTFEVEIDGEEGEIEIPEGTYTVTYSGEGYEDVTREVEISADEDDSEFIGADLPLDIPKHELTVTVVDAASEPIDTGKVELVYPPEVYFDGEMGDAFKREVPIENGTATMMVPEQRVLRRVSRFASTGANRRTRKSIPRTI